MRALFLLSGIAAGEISVKFTVGFPVSFNHGYSSSKLGVRIPSDDASVGSGVDFACIVSSAQQIYTMGTR